MTLLRPFLALSAVAVATFTAGVHAAATESQSTPSVQRRLPWAAISIQGGRTHMEDRFTIIQDLERYWYYGGSRSGRDTFSSLPTVHTAYLAVFDGHSGERCSTQAASYLHEHLVAHPAWQSNLYEAVKDGISTWDEAFLRQARVKRWPDGSTAIIALLRANILHVANVGDSRAVYVSPSGAVFPLSTDHKPNRPDEEARLVARGAWAERNRVIGRLAMSRALGDRHYKNPAGPDKHWVISEPEIQVLNLREANGSTQTEDAGVLVIASDGIWDVVSGDDCAKIIMKERHKHQQSSKNGTLMATGPYLMPSIASTVCGPDGYDEATAFDLEQGNERQRSIVVAGEDAVPGYLKTSAEVLVREALSRGSKDNITVVCIEIKMQKDADDIVGR